jgi:tRNA-specific 2-thiouridylase
VAASGTIAVALSGGVDSATAAAILVEAGHRVIGLTMRLYDAGGTRAAVGRCCGPRDLEDARAVAAHLDIPFYVLDVAADFRAHVIDDFVETYLAGETPNPCVRCNQHIKFTPLLARARALGADVLATGHYARLEPAAGGPRLHRGRDADKDQSYFLFSMPPGALDAVRFPLGGLAKGEVRARAAAAGLPNAGKPESQEICFVPDGDHAGFVARGALTRGRAAPAAGEVVDEAGRVLAQHDGVHRFTVGQRRGLGVPAATPLYVKQLEPARGRVVVAPREACERTTLEVGDLRWLGPRPSARFGATVQLRHRGRPLAATITHDGAVASVALADPAIAAPGQAAVFYDGDRVVGGGWVRSPSPSASAN